MPGFGRSSRPPNVADYALANAVGDVAGILDTLGIEAARRPACWSDQWSNDVVLATRSKELSG